MPPEVDFETVKFFAWLSLAALMFALSRWFGKKRRESQERLKKLVLSAENDLLVAIKKEKAKLEKAEQARMSDIAEGMRRSAVGFSRGKRRKI